MGKAILIVPATIELLPEIHYLEEACFSAPWTRKMLEAELTGNRFAHFLVAQEAGDAGSAPHHVIGYLCFWIVFEEVRLMNLAVFESMRRQGVGTALVTAALAEGLQHAATRAVLEVRSSNHMAQALYRGLGFRQVSTRPKYYTNPVEDAVLMELDPLVVRGSSARGCLNSVEDGAGPAH